MDPFASAFVMLLVGILALAGVFGIAAYVAKKYPDRNDPDRSRKRYVRPAASLLALACAGIGGSIVSAIIGIVT